MEGEAEGGVPMGDFYVVDAPGLGLEQSVKCPFCNEILLWGTNATISLHRYARVVTNHKLR
jgi:hypothetical protein